MFRPNVAIIMFSSESMVEFLYRIGMGMSRWWDLSICDVCYMQFIGGTGGGGYLWCALSSMTRTNHGRFLPPVSPIYFSSFPCVPQVTLTSSSFILIISFWNTLYFVAYFTRTNKWPWSLVPSRISGSICILVQITCVNLSETLCYIEQYIVWLYRKAGQLLKT